MCGIKVKGENWRWKGLRFKQTGGREMGGGGRKGGQPKLVHKKRPKKI